jgi:hypothetical protein
MEGNIASTRNTRNESVGEKLHNFSERTCVQKVVQKFVCWGELQEK